MSIPGANRSIGHPTASTTTEASAATSSSTALPFAHLVRGNLMDIDPGSDLWLFMCGKECNIRMAIEQCLKGGQPDLLCEIMNTYEVKKLTIKTKEEASCLVEAVGGCRPLHETELVLFFDHLGVEGLDEVAQAMESNPGVCKVRLTKKFSSVEDPCMTPKLLRALKNAHNLELDIYPSTRRNEQMALDIASILTFNKTVRAITVGLGPAQGDDHELHLICEALETQPGLEKLSIANLDDEGLRLLSGVLKKCNALKSVQISGGAFRSTECLAEALRGNASLKFLGISCKTMELAPVVRVFADNACKVEYLSVDQAYRLDRQALQSILGNRNLLKIDWVHAGIVDLAQLGQSLAENKTLESLTIGPLCGRASEVPGFLAGLGLNRSLLHLTIVQGKPDWMSWYGAVADDFDEEPFSPNDLKAVKLHTKDSARRLMTQLSPGFIAGGTIGLTRSTGQLPDDVGGVVSGFATSAEELRRMRGVVYVNKQTHDGAFERRKEEYGGKLSNLLKLSKFPGLVTLCADLVDAEVEVPADTVKAIMVSDKLPKVLNAAIQKNCMPQVL